MNATKTLLVSEQLAAGVAADLFCVPESDVQGIMRSIPEEVDVQQSSWLVWITLAIEVVQKLMESCDQPERIARLARRPFPFVRAWFVHNKVEPAMESVDGDLAFTRHEFADAIISRAGAMSDEAIVTACQELTDGPDFSLMH